jgi:hypothetical protein
MKQVEFEKLFFPNKTSLMFILFYFILKDPYQTRKIKGTKEIPTNKTVNVNEFKICAPFLLSFLARNVFPSNLFHQFTRDCNLAFLFASYFISYHLLF